MAISEHLDPKPERKELVRTFRNSISNYMSDLGGIKSSAGDIVILLSQRLNEKVSEIIPGVLDAEAEEDTSSKMVIELALHVDRMTEFRHRVSEIKRSADSLKIVSRSFLNSIVSQFDAYIGSLIYLVIQSNPDVLTASDRALTFTQISAFENLEEAKDFFIEKQVEDILRSSHTEHFSWLEKKLNIKLREGFASWGEFIEATEPRNLFSHANGIVSRQYLGIVGKNARSQEHLPDLGDELKVDEEYLGRVVDVFYEIGIKLGHVLWRKVTPGDRESADASLIDHTFDLMMMGEYRVTKNVLETFVSDANVGMKMKEQSRLICIVNLCTCYRHLRMDAELKTILDGIDWSAKSTQFRLAEAVQRRDWEAAAGWMEELAGRQISKEDYRIWPLFSEFRDTAEFAEVFKNVFKVDFLAYSSEMEIKAFMTIKNTVEDEKKEEQEKAALGQDDGRKCLDVDLADQR